MRPLPSKIRLQVLAVAALGLGLFVGGADRASAAALHYERVLCPQMSDDGTPFEEPEANTEVPDDPGGVGRHEKKPKNPGGTEPLENATPWLDPLRQIVRWVVQIRWIS